MYANRPENIADRIHEYTVWDVNDPLNLWTIVRVDCEINNGERIINDFQIKPMIFFL